uniref:UBC core domain-containing protein n=1 Tax=Chromera velia CCMP2878 TaxID=1169474 RepID=A0A0G4HGI0_9ALVE|eukprot:Cvel_1032.t1-p1 / transcript=Cvel_1032.t1 / gene=Cvel_1032 / organism=Chromera_velia_CCMP2878 / gene_product=Ubiquitin-conjugating enzyme E2 D3, putative / transcript_product=Ubiquitin-conjugating enzyme E2 D3, putative / location=Cvel_scaffold33:137146-139245(+) / protein_length=700 / sequence_SO=supercontig / SO=protein_coding / is_pseudo=false
MVLAEQRVRKEINLLKETELPGLSFATAENDIFNWDVTIDCPEGTPYEGKVLSLHIQFPCNNYPFEPFRITVKKDQPYEKRVAYHPTLSYDNPTFTIPYAGCDSKCDRAYSLWTPAMTVVHVLECFILPQLLVCSSQQRFLDYFKNERYHLAPVNPSTEEEAGATGGQNTKKSPSAGKTGGEGGDTDGGAQAGDSNGVTQEGENNEAEKESETALSSLFSDGFTPSSSSSSSSSSVRFSTAAAAAASSSSSSSASSSSASSLSLSCVRSSSPLSSSLASSSSFSTAPSTASPLNAEGRKERDKETEGEGKGSQGPKSGRKSLRNRGDAFLAAACAVVDEADEVSEDAPRETQSRGEREIPTALTGEREISTALRGEREIPTALRGEREIPTVLRGGRETPRVAREESESPRVSRKGRKKPRDVKREPSRKERGGEREKKNTCTSSKRTFRPPRILPLSKMQTVNVKLPGGRVLHLGPYHEDQRVYDVKLGVQDKTSLPVDQFVLLFNWTRLHENCFLGPCGLCQQRESPNVFVVHRPLCNCVDKVPHSALVVLAEKNWDSFCRLAADIPGQTRRLLLRLFLLLDTGRASLLPPSSSSSSSSVCLFQHAKRDREEEGREIDLEWGPDTLQVPPSEGRAVEAARMIAAFHRRFADKRNCCTKEAEKEKGKGEGQESGQKEKGKVKESLRVESNFRKLVISFL